jgi:hypothetical protein
VGHTLKVAAQFSATPENQTHRAKCVPVSVSKEPALSSSVLHSFFGANGPKLDALFSVECVSFFSRTNMIDGPSTTLSLPCRDSPPTNNFVRAAIRSPGH